MTEILDITEITPEYAAVLSTQEYGKRPPIDGVRLIDLRLMNDDGGSFAELIRLDEHGHLESLPEFSVRQSSYSLILPGAIKAFHLHYRQEDVWFVPPTDRLLVGLLDARTRSATSGETMRTVLGGGKAQLLHIPRGVAHGVANLWGVPGTVVYFVNQQFSIDDPDERRLPYDALGRQFWEMTPG